MAKFEPWLKTTASRSLQKTAASEVHESTQTKTTPIKLFTASHLMHPRSWTPPLSDYVQTIDNTYNYKGISL